MIWNEKANFKKYLSFLKFDDWIERWKTRKNFFGICFDLKLISKNKNQNFRIHFLIWNQKINFKKLFHFSIFVLKLKNEKWKIFKISFVFKSKNKLYFLYTDSKNVFHFSHLINAMKKEKRSKLLLTLFWFKTSFKKWKSKFSNKIFDFKSKNKFHKVLSFFNFDYKIEKRKTKNFQYLFCF